jgi:hypothetical protein
MPTPGRKRGAASKKKRSATTCELPVLQRKLQQSANCRPCLGELNNTHQSEAVGRRSKEAIKEATKEATKIFPQQPMKSPGLGSVSVGAFHQGELRLAPRTGTCDGTTGTGCTGEADTATPRALPPGTQTPLQRQMSLPRSCVRLL